jgi:CRISPR-associated protein Csm1
MDLRDQSCRVALAAYLRDIGALARRAGIDVPARPGGGAAAHEALAFDVIAAHAPQLAGADGAAPPAGASGVPLLEILEITDWLARGRAPDRQRASEPQRGNGPGWRYRPAPRSPTRIFPLARLPGASAPPANGRAQMWQVWDGFVMALRQIPPSQRRAWPAWLDHFDSAWLTSAHAVPAEEGGVMGDVSLADHSRTSAALAVALWRWHVAGASGERPFLLVQGDIFGAAEFIFADGSHCGNAASALLRGRSMQLALMAEMAALKAIDALLLPPTSQIINAAGKFLIVAPNTPDSVALLQAVQRELDAWSLEHCFGMAGAGLSWQTARCEDFIGEGGREAPFAGLMRRLGAQADGSELGRLDLCADGAAVLPASFPHGPCAYHGSYPADRIDTGVASCAMSRDQIALGQLAVNNTYLLVSARDIAAGTATGAALALSIFGYRLVFVPRELADRGGAGLARCWDISAPRDIRHPAWHGYARRTLQTHAARVSVGDERTENSVPRMGDIKRLEQLARQDMQQIAGRWRGQAGLAVLLVDVDDFGRTYQELASASVGAMTALSRRIDAFFTTYLPALCASEYPHTCTVLAGGDDAFLIGPWYSMQQLAARLAQEFCRYVAGHPGLHLSAGLAMISRGASPFHMHAVAWSALVQAKQGNKNALSCHGLVVPWHAWPAVDSADRRLEHLRQQYGLSTEYLQQLLVLQQQAQQAAAGKLEAALWRAHLAYGTRRFIVDRCRELRTPAQRQHAQTSLVDEIGERGIAALGGHYRIALYNHMHRLR